MNSYYQIALSGIVRKEVLRFMRIWQQTLLPPAVTTVLYFLVFGQVMGTKIGMMDGVAYTVFITPGLIMLAIITNTYSNVVSSFYGARFHRSIEELLVSPAPIWLIIWGYVIGGVVRGVLTALIVLAVSFFFAQYHLIHPVLALLLTLLCSILFSLAGLLNAIFAKRFDDLVIVPSFILTPLIYLGGVFYNINSLSPVWQGLSYLNPIHYLIDSFRYALLGIQAAEPIWLSVIGVMAFILVLYGYIYYVIKRGIGLKV